MKFVMRALMIITSLVSYFINEALSSAMFGGKMRVRQIAEHVAARLQVRFQLRNFVRCKRAGVCGAFGHPDTIP